MKRYEVMREIYITCSGKYFIDTSFPNEVETDNLEETLKELLCGKLPEYERKVLPDGTIVFQLHLPLPEKYSFVEF